MDTPDAVRMTHASNEESKDKVALLPLETNVSLCVDLDGSLIKSNTLWEGLWLALKTRPLECLQACLTLGKGRAYFKRRVAKLAVANPSQLPYRKALLTFLSAEAQAGRPLILATAADELVAQRVAQHLGLFAHVVASDGVINRKGSDKLAAIKSITNQFLYVGDSTADIPIWKASVGAIVVGNNRTLLKTLRQSGVTIYKHFPSQLALLRTIGRAIRVHQWPKNLLVFLPIFLDHKTMDAMVWKAGLLVLVVFCLVASVGYVFNDLLDLDADRQHSTKRNRPFASGDLAIPIGFLLLLILGFSGLTLSLFLPITAQLGVATYFAATLFYSFYLKTRLLADVIGLAMLYALRVIAGGAATAIAISPWTITFCLFFFYSLALVKRFGELRLLPKHHSVLVRRGYRKADLSVIAALGVSSGLLSVVVFALYISSLEAQAHYCSPTLLWLACPLILYWFGRIWILTNRGDIAEDPLLFSYKDRVSYIAGACMAIIWLAASVCL
ncbi:MAG TPA: UbiA family prenyltransferase [Candidatus Tectomicrobia bacterium]